MSIKVNLLSSTPLGFAPSVGSKVRALKSTEQNQEFEKVELSNGYGTATTVSVSPGYGATVTADIDIVVSSISEETFTEVIEEVKKSESYENNSEFRKQVDASEYSSAGSSSSGIFGWLVGNSGDSYSNSSSNLTEEINQYDSGNSSDDITVANSIADIMVKGVSDVKVTASVSVTGQLLVPSPTIIVVESTVFSFIDSEGNASSVTLLDQSPLVPVDSSSGTVSSNTLDPGAALTINPL